MKNKRFGSYTLYSEREGGRKKIATYIAKGLKSAQQAAMSFVAVFDKHYEENTLDDYNGVIGEGDDIVLVNNKTGYSCFLINENDWEKY